MKQKLNDGWRYGEVKSADKKEHPCLIPYESLSEDQKTKDKLFISVVRSFE